MKDSRKTKQQLIEELASLRRELHSVAASRDNFQNLFLHAVEGIYRSTPEGRIIEANDAFARIFGFDTAVKMIREVQDTHRLYVDPAVRSEFIRIMEIQGSGHFEAQIRRKDGDTAWISTNSWLVRDKHGKIAYGEGFIRDITSRKLAEEALKKSEEKYRELIENANSIILRMDRLGNVMFFNEFAERFFGYTGEEIIGRNVVGTIVPETDSTGRDLARMIEEMGREPERFASNVNENIRRNGEKVWVAWTNRPVWDDDGQLLEILCIGNDITERLWAEQALKESEQRLYSLIQGSPIPAYVIDRDHTVIYWNSALEALTGIKAEEVIGTSKHWRAFYSQKRPCLSDLVADEAFSQIPEWYAGKYQKSDLLSEAFEAVDFFPDLGNAGKWIRFTVAAIRNTAGNLIGAVESLEDITERKLSERALRDSEETFRALAENSEDTIIRFDRNCRHIYANPNFEKETGIPVGKIIGKTHREVGFPEDLTELWEKAINDVFIRQVSGRIEFQLPGGIWIDWLLVPEFDADGRVKAVMTSARDISDRKQAEQTLRKSEEYFRAITQNASDIIIILNKKGIIAYTSPSIERFLGYTPEELSGKSCLDIIHPDDIARATQDFGIAIHTQDEVIPNAFRMKHKDGTERLLEGLGKNLLNNPAVSGFVINVRDVTDRKRAEQALRKSEEFFRAITQNASDIILIVDSQGVITYASPSIEYILGYSPEELIGKSGFDFINPSDIPRAINDFGMAVLTENEVIPNAFLIRHKNGTERVLEGVGRNLFDNPAVSGFVMNIRDVTDRQRAEEALRESEKVFRLLFEKSGDGSLLLDGNRYIDCNEAALRMSGFADKSSLLGKTPWDISPERQPDGMLSSEKARGFIDCAFRTGTCRFEWVRRRSDGGEVYLDVLLTAIHMKGRDLLYITWRDISARKQMEDNLRNIRDRLDEAQRIAHIGSWDWDLIHDLVWCSDELYRIFDLDVRDRPQGLNYFRAVIHPEDRYHFESAIREALDHHKAYEAEYRIVVQDRQEKILHAQGRVFYDETGKAVRMAGVTRDVTQQKTLERQMVHREKLASLGLMIAGIAHEVNNPNNFIMFNIPILRDYVSELMPIIEDYAGVHPEYKVFGMPFEEFQEDIFKLVDNLDHGAARINRTISSLREFSAQRFERQRNLNIEEIIRKALTICSSQIDRVRVIETEIDGDIPEITGDAGAMEQIMVNLLINAVHAMDKEDSRITIRASKGEVRKDLVVIEVADNGRGIDCKTMACLFDPFFTTKNDANDMGLGLYIVKNLVDGLGGRIEVASEPGAGSTFRVVLIDTQ